MDQKAPSFTGQCFTCKKFGHKENEYRGQIMIVYKFGRIYQSFNGYCYACYGFGHKANQFISTVNVVCHKCNKPRYIARCCRSRNMRKNNLVKRNDSITKIDMTEVKNEMEKIWRNAEQRL